MSVAHPRQDGSRDHADSMTEEPRDSPADPMTGLTDREREVYYHLKQAHSIADIARLCQIEPTTVKTHIRHIYRKLGITNREELP